MNEKVNDAKYIELTQQELDNERWKSAPGYLDVLEASTMGRIKTVDRLIFNKGSGCTYEQKGAIRKTRMTGTGNVTQTGRVHVDGVVHNFSVPRLIAETFVPNPNGKEFVRQIDGDKWNSRLDNLIWITRDEKDEKGRCTKRMNEEPNNGCVGFIVRVFDTITNKETTHTSMHKAEIHYGFSKNAVRAFLSGTKRELYQNRYKLTPVNRVIEKNRIQKEVIIDLTPQQLEQEVWKQFPGSEYHRVSNMKRVKSIDIHGMYIHPTTGTKIPRLRKGKFLKLTKSGKKGDTFVQVLNKSWSVEKIVQNLFEDELVN